MSAPDDLEHLRARVGSTLVDGLLDPVGGPAAAALSPDVQSLTPGPDEAPFQMALNAGQRFIVRNGMKLSGADKVLDDSLNRITGGRFTRDQLHALEDRALNHADWDADRSLADVQPGNPVFVDPQQKASLDRLVRQSGSDALGQEAQKAYDEAWRDGRIRLRNR